MTTNAHPDEPHGAGVGQRLNWLRAGVLGANDGIVSVAALVVGVAGATTDTGALFTAGIAGLVGGAISMALGEYVSVSSQRDSERALIAKERGELRDMPEAELDELTGLYRARGLSDATARQVAEELTAHDALSAHLEVELHIDQEDLANPWHAAISSAIAFTLGALLPLAGARDLRRGAARPRRHGHAVGGPGRCAAPARGRPARHRRRAGARGDVDHRHDAGHGRRLTRQREAPAPQSDARARP